LSRLILVVSLPWRTRQKAALRTSASRKTIGFERIAFCSRAAILREFGDFSWLSGHTSAAHRASAGTRGID
jgi:hypothetical protein